jgi:hypothetical protein
MQFARAFALSLLAVTAASPLCSAAVTMLGPVPVGGVSSTVVTITFDAPGKLTGIALVNEGAPSREFTEESGGTCTVGALYAAKETCTVDVRFVPAQAGLRSGTVVLSSATGVLGAAFVTGEARLDETNANAPHVQPETRIATITAIGSSNTTPYADWPVTFTAIVVPLSGTALPTTGEIVFSVDGQVLEPITALSSGDLAAYTDTSLPKGTHSVRASYVGTGQFLESDSLAITETVGNDPPAATPMFNTSLCETTEPRTGGLIITDSTAGAAIYFTTNGATPTTSSTRYVSPFVVGVGATVKAIAIAPIFSVSAVASGGFPSGCPPK